MEPDRERLKKMAGEAAIGQVRSGMRLGLGTGSTVRHFLEALGRRIAEGKLGDVKGVPTSLDTEKLATAVGIPLTTLVQEPVLDLCVDGADEVDAKLNLIKGGGGALLKEKIVAAASRRLVIVVDQTKRVDRLGRTFPVPVEVLPFGWKAVSRAIEFLGATVELRRQGREILLTEQSNFILDCRFPRLSRSPAKIARDLDAIPGVMGHGLFLDMASEVLVASAHGVTTLTRPT